MPQKDTVDAVDSPILNTYDSCYDVLAMSDDIDDLLVAYIDIDLLT